VDWELIEGMVIIRQVGGLTQLGAALGTVVLETCGSRATDSALSQDHMRRYARQLKGQELTREEEADLRGLYRDTVKDLARRRPRVTERVVLDVTFGVRDAKLLQMTYRRCKSVRSALRELARLHGHVPVVEQGANLPFEAYKESIDKKIPALLCLPGGAFRICFGYLGTDGAQYLVVADCARIGLEQRPMHLPKRALESEIPEVRRWVERKKKKRITSDYETGSGKPLAEGVEILPFDTGGHMDAYFIYDWEVSAEGLAGNIAKLLGLRVPSSANRWAALQD